jgi:hypothetical protein
VVRGPLYRGYPMKSAVLIEGHELADMLRTVARDVVRDERTLMRDGLRSAYGSDATSRSPGDEIWSERLAQPSHRPQRERDMPRNAGHARTQGPGRFHPASHAEVMQGRC